MKYQPKVNNSPKMMVKKAYLRVIMLQAHKNTKESPERWKAYQHFGYYLTQSWRKQKRNKKFNWNQNVLF